MAAPTLRQYPFSQIVDDVMRESREESTEAKVRSVFKRRVNAFYLRDLSLRYEHPWFRRQATITLVADYATGTVAVSAGGTTVTGTSTVWTSAMTNRKFKFAGNDEVYTFTYVSATSGTIDPAFTGTSALSGASYRIIKDQYDLATDFGRVVDEPGFYYNVSDGIHKIRQVDKILWSDFYTTQPSDLATYWREFPDRNADGTSIVQITPPPDTARILNYEYIMAPTEMREVTTGTATTTAASTTVTTSTNLSSLISANQYFRSNPDGTWVRISTVAGTTVTLAEAYPTTNTTQNFAICDVPEMPYEMQEILKVGGCYKTAMEQESSALAYWRGELDRLMAEIMSIRARKRYGRSYIKGLSRHDRRGAR